MNSKIKLVGLILVLPAFSFSGCSSNNQSAQPDASSSANPSSAANQPAPSPPPAAAATPAPTVVEVPAGTTVAIRLRDPIDTGRTEVGARFEAALARPLMVEGNEVAPVGSAVTGRVADVVSSGRLNRPAELALVLTSLAPPGRQSVAIETNAWSMKGKSHKKRDAEFIGGGAAGGGLIGALAGGKKGALVGALVGGGGGTGAAAATGKKEIQLASETELNFKLASPASFPVQR